MKRSTHYVTALLLLLIMTVSAQATESFTLKAPGEKSITATDLSNGMQFGGYEGKPVIVNLFGKHCKYCQREIPHLEAMHKKFGDKVGIIGIHVQEKMMPMEQAGLGISYPVFEYEDNMAFVRFIGSRAGFRGSIPFNIIFNAKGEVTEIIPGYLNLSDLEMILTELTDNNISR